MAADHLQFLKNKFIDDFEVAVEEFQELPFRFHFQEILKVLLEKTISPSTPIVLKDPLYQLRFSLAECVMLAEKERERKVQNKKSHFNAHSVRKLWFFFRTGKRLLRIKAKLRETRDNAAAESSLSGLSLITVSEMPYFFRPIFRPRIYGFDEQLQKIEELLLKTPPDLDDANTSIKAIGIVGIGGVGKTALAHELFCRVQSQFDITISVRLFEKLNPENVDCREEIIRKILKYFDSSTSHASLNDLLHALHQKLLNRRFLIVLDGMWHVSDWYADLNSSWQMDDGASNFSHLSHGLPKGSGGAIIVTSRLEEVARRMVGEHNLVRLHPTLDAESCWSIFMDSVREKKYLNSDHVLTMERMKGEIVDNCDGLPLAALTLAEVISIQFVKEEYWSHPTKEKLFSLRLHVHDDLSLKQTAEKLMLLPGVTTASVSYHNVITVLGLCDPEEIAKQMGKFWFTELIDVK